MKRSTAVTLSMLLALGGCETFKDGPTAVAQLDVPPGSKVWGSVRFVEIGGKVTVRADVRGLRPGAQFGFHVHERGNCNAPGEHFNPTGKPHGNYRGRQTRRRSNQPAVRCRGQRGVRVRDKSAGRDRWV